MRNTLFIRKIIAATLMATGLTMALAADVNTIAEWTSFTNVSNQLHATYSAGSNDFYFSGTANATRVISNKWDQPAGNVAKMDVSGADMNFSTGSYSITMSINDVSYRSGALFSIGSGSDTQNGASFGRNTSNPNPNTYGASVDGTNMQPTGIAVNSSNHPGVLVVNFTTEWDTGSSSYKNYISATLEGTTVLSKQAVNYSYTNWQQDATFMSMGGWLSGSVTGQSFILNSMSITDIAYNTTTKDVVTGMNYRARVTQDVRNVGLHSSLTVSAGATVTLLAGSAIAGKVTTELESLMVAAGAVTMASTGSLDLSGGANIAGNAVLYNVKLNTASAAIVLSGATNSIENINGAAGLGNTVSLAAGSTTLTGSATNVTFAVANAASFTLDGGFVSSSGTAVTASLGDIVTDNGAIINVRLTDAFFANFLTSEDGGVLAPLTLAGLAIAAGQNVTINLFSEAGGDYVLGDNGTWSFTYAGTGSAVVLGTGGQGPPIIVNHYIPEPTTATLGVLGLAGLLLRRRRKA